MIVSKLDDRDSSIVYSSGWNHGGVKAEFDKTTTFTGTPGATAKLTFEGTSVAVFGTISPKKSGSIAPISSYSIDGGVALDFKAVQTSGTQYNQQFFQSPTLPEGRHTLIITNKLSSDSIFLDYLVVVANPNSNTPTPSPPQPPVSSSTATSSSASSTLSSSPTSSSSQTTPSPDGSSPTTPAVVTPSPTQVIVPGMSTQPSSATAPAGADGATKNLAAGAIAGGVISALVALALMALVVVYYRRKLRRRRRFGGFRSADSFWRPMPSEMTATSTIISSPWPPAIPPTRPTLPTDTPAENAAPYTENPIYTTVAYSSEDTEAQANPARASANTFASSFYVDERPPQSNGYPSRSYLPPSEAMKLPPNEYYAQ